SFACNTKRRSTVSNSPNATIVRLYLAALGSGAVGEDLARFFTPDAEQVDLPNKPNPSGGRSDLATLLRRAEQGKHLLERQSYEIRSIGEQGNPVAVECSWGQCPP